MSTRAKKKRRKQQMANQVLEDKRNKVRMCDMTYKSILIDSVRTVEKALESAGVPQSPYPLGASFSNGRLMSVSLIDDYRTPEEQEEKYGERAAKIHTGKPGVSGGGLVPGADQKVCLKCKAYFRTWTNADYCPECEMKSRFNEFKLAKMNETSKYLCDMAETAELTDEIKNFIENGTTRGFSIVGMGKPSSIMAAEIAELLNSSKPITLEPGEHIEYLGSPGGGMSWHNKSKIIPDQLVATSSKEWIDGANALNALSKAKQNMDISRIKMGPLGTIENPFILDTIAYQEVKKANMIEDQISEKYLIKVMGQWWRIPRLIPKPIFMDEVSDYTKDQEHWFMRLFEDYKVVQAPMFSVCSILDGHDMYLDEYGASINIKRKPGETDEDYRFRLLNACGYPQSLSLKEDDK